MNNQRANTEPKNNINKNGLNKPRIEIVSPGKLDPQIKDILKGMTNDNLSRHKPVQTTPVLNRSKRKSEEPKMSNKRKQRTTTKQQDSIMNIDILPACMTNMNFESPRPATVEVSPDVTYAYQKRLPEEFFKTYPDLKPDQLSEFEDFKYFFKSPKESWVNTPFYYKVYNEDIKPVLQNVNSKQPQALENIGKEICSGKLHVEKLTQVTRREKCDGCGNTHNVYTYRVVSLDNRNQIESSWYMGTKCGMKLSAIAFIYRVLNGISCLPINEQVMKVAFQVLNIAREACRDVSGYKSVFL